MAKASDRSSRAASAEFTQFVVTRVLDAATESERAGAKRGAGSDLHGGLVRFVGGQAGRRRRVPSASSPEPPRCPGTAPTSRPACASRTRPAGLPPPRDVRAIERGVRVQRLRISALRSPSASCRCSRRAIGFQLRLVGHGADQRVPERILAVGRERHLVDEFGIESTPSIAAVSADKTGQQICVELQTDDRGRVQRAFRCRERVGRCGRRWWPAAMREPARRRPRADTRSAPRSAVQTPSFGEVPHDLLGEERVARGPLGDTCAASVADRGIRTQELGGQRRRSPNHPAAQAQCGAQLGSLSSAPRYSGRYVTQHRASASAEPRRRTGRASPR